MKRSKYGPCGVCGGIVEERTVDQPLNLPGRVVIVESVPLGVCRRCGSRVSDATTAKKLEALLKRRSPRHRQVWTYRY